MAIPERPILSFHIDKTGGISLQRFFADLYGPNRVYFYNPERGFTRADHLPEMRRLTPQAENIKHRMLSNSLLRQFYPLLRSAIKKLEKPQVQIEVPSNFAVIHGHFSPADLQIPGARLVTVFRNPLERTLSHYQFWRDQHDKGAEIPNWFNPNMKFEDFALSKDMTNLQARRVAFLEVDHFDYLGVTEMLDRYCRYFNPSGTINVPRLNQSRKVDVQQSWDPSFVERFQELNSLDYAYYRHALAVATDTAFALPIASRI